MQKQKGTPLVQLTRHLGLLLKCLGEKQLVNPQDWVFLLGSVCFEAAACWSMHCKTENQENLIETHTFVYAFEHTCQSF